MGMHIFRMKKPSCKILKTKNCDPFEVQYTSRCNRTTLHAILSALFRSLQRCSNAILFQIFLFCFVWFDSLHPSQHNTAKPMMLEPAAPWSRVKHSTTEPLCSLYCFSNDYMSIAAIFDKQACSFI